VTFDLVSPTAGEVWRSPPEAQLSADHLGVGLGPVVVTHGAPVPLVVDLQPALPGAVSPHQTHHSVCKAAPHHQGSV